MNNDSRNGMVKVSDHMPIVRVAQPSMAKYRLPIFRCLANDSRIRLKVFWGELSNLDNALPDGFESEPSRHVTYRFFSVPILWHWAQIKAANGRRGDVVILPWNWQYLTLLPALMLARFRGVRSVLWGHGYSKRETRGKKFLRNFVARFGDALLFYDAFHAIEHLSASRRPDQPCYVASNTIDLSASISLREQFELHTRALEQFRARHALVGQFVLLHTSRYDPENQVEKLIESADSLFKNGIPVTVILIGRGLDRCRRIAAAIDQADTGLPIHFLGAIYEEAELAPWYMSADAFVYPSNIGLSLLHAFAYGLPVVTSDWRSAQNPEFERFKHQVNGLSYKHNCTRDLTHQLSRLYHDPKLRNRLKRGAIASSEKCSVSTMVDGMISAALGHESFRVQLEGLSTADPTTFADAPRITKGRQAGEIDSCN